MQGCAGLWGAVTICLPRLQRALPGSIHTVLLLAEKEAASHLEKLPGVQVGPSQDPGCGPEFLSPPLRTSLPRRCPGLAFQAAFVQLGR